VDGTAHDASGEKKAKGGEKEAKEQLALMEKAVVLLREGKPARNAEADAGRAHALSRAEPDDIKAGAVCLQCRGRRGRRHRQQILESRRSHSEGRRRRHGGHILPPSRRSRPQLAGWRAGRVPSRPSTLRNPV